MKNRIFTGIAIFVFCIITFAVQASDTDRAFKGYDIVPVNAQELSGNAEKAWVLSYDNNESPIVITLYKKKKAKHFVVQSQHFEVAYVCCKKGFGASRVKAEYSNFPEELTSKVINDSELSRQKLLTPNQVSEEQALQLIAAYLPDLVNPSYKHLLN